MGEPIAGADRRAAGSESGMSRRRRRPDGKEILFTRKGSAMNSNRTNIGIGRMAAVMALCTTAGLAVALPPAPVYTRTVTDAVTGGNSYVALDGKTRWTVTPGADNYFVEIYERPMASGFEFIGARFGSEEYFEFVDIAQAKIGNNAQWLFVSIDMVGLDKITSNAARTREGLLGSYSFRFSNDADGRFGFLVLADQPEVKNLPNTTFGPLGTFVYADSNGDVGGAATAGSTGLLVTKFDNADEESGMNGYDEALIQDGRGPLGNNILFMRVSPTDNTVVEIALDYIALGLTRQQVESLRYFDVDAFKGSPDLQGFHRNDKWSPDEAGSPNVGIGGASEFGTPGLGQIAETDSVRVIGATSRCRADFNRDGTADFFDYLDFVAAFSTGDSTADFNGDGTIDFFDYLDFVQAFDAGCN
jgi:hypothetical protein